MHYYYILSHFTCAREKSLIMVSVKWWYTKLEKKLLLKITFDVTDIKDLQRAN